MIERGIPWDVSLVVPFIQVYNCILFNYHFASVAICTAHKYQKELKLEINKTNGVLKPILVKILVGHFFTEKSKCGC